MSQYVLRYHPGQFHRIPATVEDDSPPFRDVYPPTEVTRACHNVKYRTPSKDVWSRIKRTEGDDGPDYRHRWSSLSRVYATAMVLCDYGFPGPVRRDHWVEQGLCRASRWTQAHGIPDTVVLRSMVGSGIDQVYREVLTAARIAAKLHYNDGVGPGSTEGDVLIRISDAVCDDNYIYADYKDDGTKRSEPFRHPAISAVLSALLFGVKVRDRFNFRTYFYPKVPISLITLVCTALRCALDELWTGPENTTLRAFTREQYGPILHTLTYRWYRLDADYAEKTQILLGAKLDQAYRDGPASRTASKPPAAPRWQNVEVDSE